MGMGEALLAPPPAWLLAQLAPRVTAPLRRIISLHTSHCLPSASQAWLGEKFVCQEPDQLTIGDYVSVCSAVTVVCSTGECSLLRYAALAGCAGLRSALCMFLRYACFCTQLAALPPLRRTPSACPLTHPCHALPCTALQRPAASRWS